MLDAAQINVPMPPLSLRTCPVCGGTMEGRTILHATCSAKCGRLLTGQKNRRKLGPRRSMAERFWSKVDKTPGLGPTGECWEWKASRRHNAPEFDRRYGNFAIRANGQTLIKSAHVVAYELTYGPLPEGTEGCHTCDWPPCVRPNHVWAGTHQQNIRDAQAKGRMRVYVPDTRPRVERVKLSIAQGELLKEHRQNMRLSIYGVGRVIGMDYTAYYRAEKGERGIRPDQLEIVCEMVGLAYESLGIAPDQIARKGLPERLLLLEADRKGKPWDSKWQPTGPRKKPGRPRKYRGPVEMARFLLGLNDEQEAS